MKKYFITGLAILLPVSVTIVIFAFVVNFLTKPFLGMVSECFSHTKIKDVSFLFLTSEEVIRYGSKIIILLGLLLIILIIGYIARLFFFKSLLNIGDKILHKIPIVNKIYKTTQEIIKTLFVTDKKSFTQVVLAPFPTEESYTLGLVSRASPQTCSDEANSDLVSVFIPTAPTPTNGFLLMFKKEDLIFLSMKTEDALKYIVSCGVVLPEQNIIEEKGDQI
jgi:uncharacterized membrane protein